MKNSVLLGIALVLSVTSVILFNGCSQSDSPAQITIKFPQASKDLTRKVGSLISPSPWSGSISGATDINCYAVMIGGPEFDLSHSYCNQRSTGARLMNFGYYAGGIPAGGSISLEVPPGLERNIYLVGMQANATYCKDFHGHGPTEGQITHPRLIDTVATSLDPGEQRTVQINIPSDLSLLPEIDQCEVNDFPTDGGTSPVHLFGNGRDGSYQTTASYVLNMNSSTLNASASLGYSQEAGSPITGAKVISATRHVLSVDSGAHDLTLNSAFTSSEFEAGDEILWAVVSRHPANSSACGGGLDAGSWGMQKITSISGTVITLEQPISGTPGTLVAPAFFSANTGNASNHCRIQVMRMPSFNNIHVQAGNPLNINAQTLDGDRQKGIVAFRVKHLILDDNLTVDVNQMSYPNLASGTGGSPSGDGALGTTQPAYESAGGTSGPEGGGAGGHQNPGGTSAASAPGGNAINYCSGACFPIRDNRIYFGAGGGSGGVNPGGVGGGIIVIHAERITGSGALLLHANGQAGTGTGAGGGAGGTIHLTSAQLGGGPPSFQAKGGDGSSPGGGASGGAVEVSFCEAQAGHTSGNLTSISSVNGGTGGGSAAGLGAIFINNESTLCL